MLVSSTTHSVSSYSVQVETVTLSDRGTGSHSTLLIKHMHTLHEHTQITQYTYTHIHTRPVQFIIGFLYIYTVKSTTQTSPILLPTQPCECYDRYPVPNSSSSSVVVMVIGWVLFTITLIVCGIIITLLVRIIMRRHPNNKLKTR